ncbi:MAG: gliding motility lipoprotein GldD [Paludibacteraceae bacterium]|jgi:gliding motility-associated lipoprotein GldD|nr:gliding motility lipoprotein GldD [Paludibacteraceae bacterium]
MKKCFFAIVLCVVAVACQRELSPRPYGYFRIDLPENEYRQLDSVFPFRFHYSQSARVVTPNPDEPFWIDVFYPKFDAKIHCSYERFAKDMFQTHAEESHTLAYKHVVRADAITEQVFVNEEKNVYGILYEFKGNAASQVQFFLTDSVSQFLRGSLYFNSLPNPDSIAPVLEFIRRDVVRLVETTEWK